MPSKSPSACSLNATLISSTVVDFSTCATKSMIETVGVGTRRAKPSNLPFNSGMTSATARAAQILVRAIDQHLVAGVGVDRRHEPLHHAELLQHDLRDRREAVGRAGSV